MNFTQSLIAFSLASLLSGCIVISTPLHADVHLEKELSLDVQQLSNLNIDSGDGSLTIIGKEGITQIVVQADIYTTYGRIDDYDFTLSASKNSATLVAKMNNTSGLWIGNSPHMDIKVVVPKQLLLDINDGSGDILVSDINAAVTINDGSGDLSMNNILGNLTIIDGSGELSLNKITGDINIEDGSGDISVMDVMGNAIITDGSGDLMVHNISGVVSIDDGSGDIDIEHAGGLKILSAGSGGLRVKNISGDFDIDTL